MNDLKPFKHGEEGTHAVCNKHLAELGGKATCCECSGKTDCSDTPQKKSWEGNYEHLFNDIIDVVDGHGQIPPGKTCYGPPCKGADTKLEECRAKLRPFIAETIAQARSDERERTIKEVKEEILRFSANIRKPALAKLLALLSSK